MHRSAGLKKLRAMKSLRRRALFLGLFSLAAGLGLAAEPVKHVDATAAAALVEAGKVTVLDVRTAEEYAEGHVKGAVNLDILESDFQKKLAALDKSKPVLVHCQAGGRSTRSLPTLEKAGFPLVYHLDGGMNDWVAKGKPVEKGAPAAKP